jgi:hypothetical protein
MDTVYTGVGDEVSDMFVFAAEDDSAVVNDVM